MRVALALFIVAMICSLFVSEEAHARRFRRRAVGVGFAVNDPRFFDPAFVIAGGGDPFFFGFGRVGGFNNGGFNRGFGGFGLEANGTRGSLGTQALSAQPPLFDQSNRFTGGGINNLGVQGGGAGFGAGCGGNQFVAVQGFSRIGQCGNSTAVLTQTASGVVTPVRLAEGLNGSKIPTGALDAVALRQLDEFNSGRQFSTTTATDRLNRSPGGRFFGR